MHSLYLVSFSAILNMHTMCYSIFDVKHTALLVCFILCLTCGYYASCQTYCVFSRVLNTRTVRLVYSALCVPCDKLLFIHTVWLAYFKLCVSCG